MPDRELDGNAAQVRAIIEQTVSVVEARAGTRRASWPAWLALGLAFAGMIYAGGVLSSDIASATSRSLNNERRIEQLERDRATLARIETKVDMLMEDRKTGD